MGDGQEAMEIATEMLKYNRKHPGAAITGDVIKRSMAQHMKTSQEMYHGITLSKSLRPQLLMEASEYEEDVEQ
jgi:succinyl-CoA synthetase beta subunit